jgi:hypothetical protein
MLILHQKHFFSSYVRVFIHFLVCVLHFLISLSSAAVAAGPRYPAGHNSVYYTSQYTEYEYVITPTYTYAATASSLK